jgi:hypothetical protein
MIKSIVKAYQRKYNTKGKVKPSYSVTKQINIPVDCDLEGDDIVYVLSEAEYKELIATDDSITNKLQESLNSQKEFVERLNKEVEEYKEKETIAIDTLAINNKLLSDIEQLHHEIKEYDKQVNELKLVNQLLLNRSLIARILNKSVNIVSDDIKYVETDKE